MEQVRQLLIEAITPLCQEENAAGQSITDTSIPVSVSFSDFGDSSVDLFVVCWVLVEEKAAFVAKVKEVIYNTLNKNKVEIPFPQQDIYVRHIEMPKHPGKKLQPVKEESISVEAGDSVEEDNSVAEGTVTPVASAVSGESKKRRPGRPRKKTQSPKQGGDA